MTYRFLEHTADARVECRADTFDGLLRAATDAFYHVTLTEVRDGRGIRHVVDIVAPSHEEMVVRWLQELLFLLDTERFVAGHYTFEETEEGRVRAVLDGYICLSEERAVEVKAVTYHGLDVVENSEGFMARIIFDL